MNNDPEVARLTGREGEYGVMFGYLMTLDITSLNK